MYCLPFALFILVPVHFNVTRTYTTAPTYIFIILLLPLLIAGNINWTLRENPAVFGTNIHLVCHLPKDTCCNDHRKWSVGSQYSLIIINGFSYNISKYKEDLIMKDQVSVLTIFSFNEEDVDVLYECVYGFQKYRSVLKLEDDRFEYHPTETLPVTPTSRGNNISFSIHFKKIFPIPHCQARLGVHNVSSFLSVTVRRRTLFYESSLAFTYFSTDSACKDSLTVWCTVGRTVLTVVDYKAFPVSNVAAQDKLLPSILISSIAIVVIAAIIIVLYKIRRAQRNVSRCSHNIRQEAEQMLRRRSRILV